MEVIRNIPDAVIIDTLQKGKSMDEAVKALYRDHFESLAWFVMNNSGSKQDAEDIFQDVIVSFIDLVKKGKFRGEASIKTFLFAMNKNTWLNELKRRGRAGQRELKYEKEQDKMEMDTTHFIADREATKQVMDLVGELGDTCKKILLMFYYENLSMKEILEGLDYENEQVVRNKKYKCLKQLEQMITANPALKQNLKNLLHG
jgi:RNA polymerase sigma factor (sigma-70 family)